MGQRVGHPAPQGLAVAWRILAGYPLDDGNGACPTCSQMARRETYKLVGGFDPNFRRNEDTELCVRSRVPARILWDRGPARYPEHDSNP